MSTSRYNNAGQVGATQTLDNMGSRHVAWSNYSYAGGLPSMYQSLAVSTLADLGVGVTRTNTSVSGNGSFSGVAMGFCWHCYGYPPAVRAYDVYTYDGAPGAGAPVAQDAPYTVCQMTGYLA